MLIFVLQTLAEILAGGTSLTSTEQIDFSHPGNRREEGAGPTLNLYIFDIRESKQVQHSGRQVERKLTRALQPATVNWAPAWFDVSLLLTAWDRTALGEHHFISEALTVLLRHRTLEEEFLVPELRGYGNLNLTVALEPPIEIGSLWSALNVPLRSALYLTVTIPFEPQPTPVPLVWERIFNLRNQLSRDSDSLVLTRRVAIAGIVKSAVTNLPLVATEVAVRGTEKSILTTKEGLFFFEDLHLGNYVLTLNHPGYLPQNVNALVDNQSNTFKEIFLTPE